LHALLSIHHEIVPDVSHIEKVFFKQNEAFDIHPMSTSMLRRIFGCDFRGIARDEYIEMVDGFMKIVARDFPMSQPLQPLFIGGISGAKCLR
jgi:hypothetical protein